MPVQETVYSAHEPARLHWLQVVLEFASRRRRQSHVFVHSADKERVRRASPLALHTQANLEPQALTKKEGRMSTGLSFRIPIHIAFKILIRKLIVPLASHYSSTHAANFLFFV